MKIMKKLLNYPLRVALYIVLVLSISLFPPLARKMLAGQENTQKTLIIREKKLLVEVADTAEKRTGGLMFREKLDKDAGMLFVFEKVAKTSFWMFNTTIPLSIAFIDENGIILQIEDLKPKDLSPVYSNYKVLYALEVNKDWFKKNKIKVGDVVKGIK